MVEKAKERKAAAPAPPVKTVPPITDFSKFDRLASEDDHRAYGGKKGGNDRYNITPELMNYLKGKLDKAPKKKMVWPIEAVKEFTQYKGKARDDNFLYGLQTAIARAQKKGVNTYGIKAGLRDSGKKVCFAIKSQ